MSAMPPFVYEPKPGQNEAAYMQRVFEDYPELSIHDLLEAKALYSRRLVAQAVPVEPAPVKPCKSELTGQDDARRVAELEDLVSKLQIKLQKACAHKPPKKVMVRDTAREVELEHKLAQLTLDNAHLSSRVAMLQRMLRKEHAEMLA